jgi:hypothetical protein
MKAAGSRWLPSASASSSQNPSPQPAPLALSQMRRSHVCGAKTDCRRAYPYQVISIPHDSQNQSAADFRLANMELGWNCAEKKRYPDAIAECEAAVNRVPDEQVVLGICGRVFGLAGRRKEALMLLKRLMNVA